MRKSRKLWLFLVISMPLLMAAVIWAWAEDSVFVAVYYGSVAVIFSVFILLAAREFIMSGDADEADYVVDGTPYSRRRIVFFKAFWGLWLTAVIVNLVRRVFGGSPPYLILMQVWWMTIFGAPLFFTSLYLDTFKLLENKFKKRSHRLVTVHKAAKPYQFKIKDNDPKYLRELLSCPNCRFHNKEASQKGQPWCNAPHPPEIQNNYCNTFEQER